MEKYSSRLYLMALCSLQNVPYSFRDDTLYIGKGTVVIPQQTIFKEQDFKKNYVFLCYDKLY